MTCLYKTNNGKSNDFKLIFGSQVKIGDLLLLKC